VSWSDIGDSFDNASNARRLAGYTLVAVRGAFQLNETVQLYGRIENATDEAYQTAFRYGSPPRQAFVGVRLRR
jgi:vitamin B12 transporter